MALFKSSLLSFFICLPLVSASATESFKETALNVNHWVKKPARDGTRGGECPGMSCDFVVQKIMGRQTTDGAFEILLAVIFSNNSNAVDLKVIYDGSGRFTTNIEDPGSYTFYQLGIRTILNMKQFKQNLAALLPTIESDIEKIPNNPGIKIADIARYVQVALQVANRY